MDQPGSGPRHDADATSEQRPLIIERSDLAHPLRRFFAFALTLAAWAGWLAMWFFAARSLSARLGWLPPDPDALGENSVIALHNLLAVFPLAVGLVLAILALNGLLNGLFRLFKKPQAHSRVGIEKLASAMAFEPGQLEHWQSGRILRVEHGPRGRVTDVEVVRSTPATARS